METKSGLSVFSINEHRLSLGLLLLILLCGLGYGIWIAISPFVPNAAANDGVESRKLVAEQHFSKKEWPEAIDTYRQMLADDPENGFASMRIAEATEEQLATTWSEYSRLSATTGNANAGTQILEKEEKLFNATRDQWNSLMDNTRYQRQAFERLAVIHCRRSSYLKAPEEVDNAVKVLEEMFNKGHATPLGIRRMNELSPLRSHPEFSRLEKLEGRNFNRGLGEGNFQAPWLRY